MIKAYDRENDWSYALGAFPTIELIKKQPESLVKVIISSKLKMTEELEVALSGVRDITEVDDRSIARISDKGNVYVAGVFKKRYRPFGSATHVALVRPSDAGNLGTILRTMTGFGVKNLAIIGPDAVDEYSPKAVRASMGAVFSVNIEKYGSFQEYAEKHTEKKYLFMLGASESVCSVKPEQPCAMIFGNEATGLPPEYASFGQPLVIRHSDEIDSLNLPQAVAISLYEFTKTAFNHL